MYLRTTKRKNKDGSIVAYYQLAHNERHPITGKPVAKIIHNFGRADQVEREQLVRLCRSIARVCGLTVLDPAANQAVSMSDAIGLPEDLKLKRTVSLGTVWVAEALWQRIGIQKTLKKVIGKKRNGHIYERALFAMVANRLSEPESKLGVWDRWLEKVYLPSCGQLKLRQMYDAMDWLYENAEAIEKDVFFTVANLFNLTVDLIFYDTTTASFAIDQEDGEDDALNLRKFGLAKEGFWSPQVVVALAVTREGLPVRCWVFPGNTTDVDTIERVRTDLRGWKLGRALFVADAGFNSENNRQELARACGKYLLACRMTSVAQIKRDVLSKRGRYTTFKDNLRAKEVVLGDGERRCRYILCHNPKEARRQQRHRSQIIEMLEQELAKHPDKDASAQWAIELQASRRFKRYLTVTKTKRIRIDRSKVRQAARYDGKWVIETNDDTISLEDAACGYKSLMVIERCFRSLKRTQIKLTPMYHWLSKRIESHVRICVLALLIERIAELSCEKPWHQIRRELETVQASNFFNLSHSFDCRNELTKSASNIFKSLNIQPPNQVLNVSKHA